MQGATLLASDAVNRETVQDLIDFSLIICRSEIALQQISISGRPRIRADTIVLCFERTGFRTELTRNTLVVLPVRVEDRGV